MLPHRFNRFPGALETRRDDEAVALFQPPALARLIGQHRLALDEMTEFPLGIVHAYRAGRAFPDPAIESTTLRRSSDYRSSFYIHPSTVHRVSPARARLQGAPSPSVLITMMLLMVLPNALGGYRRLVLRSRCPDAGEPPQHLLLVLRKAGGDPPILECLRACGPLPDQVSRLWRSNRLRSPGIPAAPHLRQAAEAFSTPHLLSEPSTPPRRSARCPYRPRGRAGRAPLFVLRGLRLGEGSPADERALRRAISAFVSLSQSRYR